MTRAGRVLIVSVGALALSVPTARAQAVGNVLDGIVRQYQTAANTWAGNLSSAALKLFFLLAFLELLWIGIKLVLKNADLGEFLTELVSFVLSTGLFLAFIENSQSWALDIIDSFRQAGALATGSQTISPSSVFATGYDIAVRMIQGTDSWNFGHDLEFVVSGLVIIVAFALICAFLILALVESYVVIGAGVLFLGFGGSRWTKDIALKVIMYIVAIAAKLFIMELLIGIGLQIFDGISTQFQPDLQHIITAVGTTVVLLALVQILPNVVQGMISGASFSGGGALVGAAAAVGGAVAGGGAAGVAALALGASQTSQGIGSMQQGGGRMARLLGAPAEAAVRAGGALLGAGASDLGRQLSGRPGSTHGSMLGRMAGDLSSRIGKAAPPPGPSPAPSPGSGAAPGGSGISGGQSDG